jgi:hypothetical protein
VGFAQVFAGVFPHPFSHPALLDARSLLATAVSFLSGAQSGNAAGGDSQCTHYHTK